MILRKIQLENYRSHKETEILLSQGVNLILGENGSGKSSILEAIGSVLFDIRDRAGKQKGRQFIRHGAKNAKIYIEFLANDGREYSVEQTFTRTNSGVSSKKLQLTDMTTGEVYNGLVTEKLQELCGLKREFRDIYDQIIIAKQNEFIHIFKESPSTREETFNKIFNTQIYSQMSDSKSMLKEMEESYSREIEKIELKKNIVASGIQNEEQTVLEWKREKAEEELVKKEIQALAEEKKILEEKYSFFQRKIQEKENLSKRIAYKTELCIERKKQLKQQIKEAKSAKEARQIVDETQEDYEQYQNLWKEIESRQKKWKEAKLQEEKNQRLQSQNEKWTWEIQREEEEQKKRFEFLIQAKEEQKILEEEIERNIQAEKTWREQEQKWRNLQKDLQVLQLEKTELEKTIFSLEEAIKSHSKMKSEKESRCSALDTTEIDFRLKELAAQKKELETKQYQISSLQENKKILVEAEEKLQEKFCPLLGEICDNVKNVDVHFYFSDKISILEKKETQLQEEIKDLQARLGEEKKWQERKNELAFLLKELEEEQKELEALHLRLEKKRMERKEKQLSHQEKLLEVAMKSSEELQLALENITMEISKLHLEEKQKNAGIQCQKIEDCEKEQKRVSEEILEKKQKIENNKQQVDFSVAEMLPLLSKEIDFFSKQQKELSEKYDLYLKHHQLAMMSEEMKKKVFTSWKNLHEHRQEILFLRLQKEEHTKELARVSIEEIQANKERVEEKLLERNKKMAACQEKISQLSKELEKIQEEKTKIEAFALILKKLRTKLEKTKRIRSNIKSMGVKISEYMLESIAQAASYNFQKMTGRTEQILWSNADKDKYAVYLIGKEGKTPFEHLSGGEQVVVAISLRETLTEYFSNARFMILDEPTNNLDQERKKMLAEYMAEMLKNLDQSIIVTHDNTFREMAERVIELEK